MTENEKAKEARPLDVVWVAPIQLCFSRSWCSASTLRRA